MEQLTKQIEEYNRFMKQVVREHMKGVKPEDQELFIEWIMMNIGRLFMKYEVLGDPEKVLSAGNVFGTLDS